MKLTSLCLLGLLAASAAAYGQTTSSTTSTTMPDGTTTTTTTFSPATRNWWQADVAGLYSFRMRTPGISADLGGATNPGNFVGVEWNYFHPKETDYDPVAGPIYSREDVNMALVVDRFTLPASRFGWDMPLAAYVGGGVGLGFVQDNVSAPRYGIYGMGQDNGVFAAEGVAGLRYSLTPNIALKVGYRYYYLNNVRFFGQRANIDGSAIEYGISFRY